jgi:hypothetical protein
MSFDDYDPDLADALSRAEGYRRKNNKLIAELVSAKVLLNQARVVLQSIPKTECEAVVRQINESGLLGVEDACGPT